MYKHVQKLVPPLTKNVIVRYYGIVQNVWFISTNYYSTIASILYYYIIDDYILSIINFWIRKNYTSSIIFSSLSVICYNKDKVLQKEDEKRLI